MERVEVVVLGGGVAGLATSLALSRAGVKTVLLEREPVLASHSSGRNAAMWIPTYGGANTPALARRTAELLNELTDAPWLERRGALLVGERAQLDAPAALAAAEDVPHERLEAEEAVRRSAALAGGNAPAALWLPDAGVLDIHVITECLAAAARSAGVTVRLGCEAARVLTQEGRVEGIQLADGERLGADAVVIASGAWAAAHGNACGAPLPLRPLRRHLALLKPLDPALAEGPLVWSIDPEAYFRPEAGGVLASPCDEELLEPCLPDPQDEALELLAERLAVVAPALAESQIRRSWACLRTFAPDRELVAGPDPRIEGLHWLAGLGGRGMTVGVAAGELTSELLQGKERALAGAVSPTRLLSQ